MKFRRKVVEVEAIQIKENFNRTKAIEKFVGEPSMMIISKDDDGRKEISLTLRSQYYPIHFHVGDYLYRDIDGKYRSCSEEHFLHVYEEVEE